MLLQPGCSAKSSWTSSNYQHRDLHNRCSAVSTQEHHLRISATIISTVLYHNAGHPHFVTLSVNVIVFRNGVDRIETDLGQTPPGQGIFTHGSSGVSGVERSC